MRQRTIDRREQRRWDTRRRLLDAAEQVFSEKGYDEATVLDITDAADVSKRTFYLHFTDKEDVIEALALRLFTQIREQIETHKAHNDTTGDPRTHMFWLTERVFQYTSEYPEMMELIFGRGGSFRLQAMSREYLVRAWEEAMTTECKLQPDARVPLPVLAHAIAGIVHQLLCWWFQKPNTYSPADMASMCTSVLFDSIDLNFEKLHCQETTEDNQI